MANILITGGAGYIGSVLTPLLIEDGHKVTVVDNYKYNQTSLADLIINPNFNLIIKIAGGDFMVVLINLILYAGSLRCTSMQ